MRHLTDDMRAGMSGHIADGLGLPPQDTESGCVDREKGTAGTLGLTWFAKFNEHLAIVDTPFVREVLCSRAGSPPAQEASQREQANFVLNYPGSPTASCLRRSAHPTGRRGMWKWIL